MENIQEFMEKMEKTQSRQLLWTRILCILSVILVGCMLVMTATVSGAVTKLTKLTEPMEEMVGQAEIVIANFKEVTQELAEADLGSLAENVNNLAIDSQSAVSEAMEKLDSINIDTLNKAISDLASIVAPLAKVSNFFG